MPKGPLFFRYATDLVDVQVGRFLRVYVVKQNFILRAHVCTCNGFPEFTRPSLSRDLCIAGASEAGGGAKGLCAPHFLTMVNNKPQS
jgi:hypothetical protein